jgi:hypothetical protein
MTCLVTSYFPTSEAKIFTVTVSISNDYSREEDTKKQPPDMTSRLR